MPSEISLYQIYLLRLWPANTDQAGLVTWRASLESLENGERLGFASLELLFAYLLEQVEGNKQVRPNLAAKEDDLSANNET